MGTPTENAESGTADEILEFRKKGKHVLLYFSRMPAIPTAIDATQLQALVQFKEKCFNEGLIVEFDSVQDLGLHLTRHLSKLAQELRSKNAKAPDEPPVSTTATDAAKPAPERDNGVRNVLPALLEIAQRSRLEWNNERASRPLALDGGKAILRRLGTDLQRYRLELDGIASNNMTSKVDDIIRACKTLQQHQVYLDGGMSYREFWDYGDEIYGEIIPILSDAPSG